MAHLHFNGGSSIFLSDVTLQAAWLPIEASYSSQLREKARIAEIQFGDGYAHRGADGINHLMLSFDLRFVRRRAEICAAVVKFLRGGDPALYDRAPYEYFYWTPPFPSGGSELKFVCKEWTIPFEEYNAYTMSMVFEQVFDP